MKKEFRLSMSPRAGQQRQAFMAAKGGAAVPLPKDLAAVLEALACSEPETSPEVSDSVWFATVRAVRATLLRATFVSLVGAVAAATATLAGMQVLKIRQGGALPWGAFVCFVLSNLVVVGTALAANRLRAWVGLGVECELARRLTLKLATVRSRDLMAQGKGSLKVLLTSDARNVGGFMDNAVRNLMPILAALVVAVPLLLRFSGWGGVAGLGTLALMLPVVFALSRWSARYQSRIQRAMDQQATIVGEAVRNIRILRFLGWEPALVAELQQNMRHLTGLSMGQGVVSFLLYGISLSWWMLSVASVALTAHLLGRPLDLPRFFGSLWIITLLSGYLMHIPTLVRFYANASASMGRIKRFLALPDLVADMSPGGIQDGRPTRISLEDVSHSAPEGNPILEHLNLTLEMNHCTALIGPVGCGKSTLLRLICGEERPTSGRIRVGFEDGRWGDLWEESTRRTWRVHLAWTPQLPFISSDTLVANITLDPAVEEAEALRAAQWAELEADLATFADGLHQALGEAGVNLSGGQRQRVSLARAKASGRPYLVLDDPLSAVDMDTEAVLAARLRGQGCLLVSHRMGELLAMDRVLVMEEGRITEDGSPLELRARPDSRFTQVCEAYLALDVPRG